MVSNLRVSSSPHLKSKVSTQSLMRDAIIALMPALVVSIFIFGPRVILVVGITVASCIGAEYISRMVMKREQTFSDLSAVVTGLLLAFNFPVGLPLWMAVLGGMIAIILAKQMFGGIGQNFVNPALAARAFLMVSFPVAMITWPAPVLSEYYDVISTATPLGLIAADNLGDLPTYLNLFIGNQAGSLGETSAFALLLGGGYLLVKKIISPIIPFTFIGTVFISAILLGQNPIIHILSGGLFLGAFFMATDYTTSPITNKGKVIFAIGCGFLTMMIRVFGALPEGVSFAILIMNILVPHIENLTTPTVLGGKRG